MAFTVLGVQGAKASAEQLKAELVRTNGENERLVQTVERAKTKEKKINDEHKLNVAAAAGVTVGSSYLWNLLNGAMGKEKGVWDIYGEVPGDAVLGSIIGTAAFIWGKGWFRDIGVGLGAGGLASFAARQGMHTGIKIANNKLAADAAVAQLQSTPAPHQFGAAQNAPYDGHTVSFAQKPAT